MNSRRIFACWYICIGAGFAALGLRALIAGVQMWAIGIRFAISLGFVVLGVLTLRAGEK